MRTRTLPPNSAVALQGIWARFRCRRALFRPHRLCPDRARRADHIPAVAIGQPAAASELPTATSFLNWPVLLRLT